MKTKGSTLRILKRFQSRKVILSILLGLILAATFFDIVVPIISQRLIDTLIAFFKNGGGTPVAVLVFSAVGILVATLVNRVLKSVYDYQLFKTVTGLEDGIRGEAFEKYLRLHVLYHHGASSGQIIGRIERGTSATYAILYDIFGQNLVPSFLVVGGVIVTLLTKSPLMALVVFLPLPIYFLSVRKLTERIYSIERRSNERFEDISKHSYDVAGNVLTVKKFSQEFAERKNQKTLLERARTIQYSAERLWSILENIQTLISMIGKISVILLGGFFCSQWNKYDWRICALHHIAGNGVRTACSALVHLSSFAQELCAD